MAGPERMIRQRPFLNDVLREARANRRRQKLLYANADQINALSELVMNTIRGNVPPRRSTLRVLKPQANVLRMIANAKNSIKRRRQLLQQQTGAGIWNELRRSYLSGKRIYQY